MQRSWLAFQDQACADQWKPTCCERCKDASYFAAGVREAGHAFISGQAADDLDKTGNRLFSE